MPWTNDAFPNDHRSSPVSRLGLAHSIPSLEEIERMSYKEAIHLIRKQNKSARDLRTREDAQEFLRLLFHPKPSVDVSTDSEFFEYINAETKKFRQQQKELATICGMIQEKFIDATNPRMIEFVRDMEISFDPQWTEKLKALKKTLQSHKTPILVAGETGSGKSSLINMLINDPLLPCADHPCTASICVIKDSKERYVRLRHSKDNDQKLDLEDNNRKEWNAFVSDRSPIEANDLESTYCRRAIFYTPLSHLPEGTYFVDSPGFREDHTLTQVLHKFMPKAGAIILVLRTDNCGGLGEPVKEFITRVYKSLSDASLKTMENELDLANVNSITRDNVLFVFNRWDQVQEHEAMSENKQRIRNNCLKTLQDLWPDVEENKNVFFLSVTQAFARANQNVAPGAAVNNFKKAVFSLIPKSHDSRVSISYMWLEHLSRSISNLARLKINMAKYDESDKVNEQNRLSDALGRASEEQRPHLKKIVDAQQNELLGSLLDHLRSDAALTRMCAFEGDKNIYGVSATQVHMLPVEDNFEKLWSELQTFFIQRILREAEYWNEEKAWSFDSETGVRTMIKEKTRFGKAISELRTVIFDKLAHIDDEAHLLKSFPENEDTDLPTLGKNTTKSLSFRTVEKTLFGITAIIWVPLAVVGSLIALPVMAGIFAKHRIEGNMKLKAYHHDKAGVAAVLLKNFVTEVLDEEILKHLLEENFFSKLEALKAQLDKYFPKLIEEFKQRIEHLSKDQRTQEEIQADAQPILEEARIMLSHLYHFAALQLHLKIFKFSEEHIVKLKDVVPRGELSVTMSMKCRSFAEHVAVKMVCQPISPANAYDIFREEQAWRTVGKFKHRNIVELHGLVAFGQPRRIGFVTERSDQTLQELVRAHPALVPFVQLKPQPKNAAFEKLAAMASQISCALCFIHQNNYIHRSLKMDTVLVYWHGSEIILKLCDFGLSRVAGDVTITVVGTHIYLSPEVLNGRGCSSASDVYALGLLLWELYHAEEVFNWFPSRDLRGPDAITALKKLYAAGKMELVFKDEAMPMEYRSLLLACTHSQAAMRPAMNQVYDRVKSMLPSGEDRVLIGDAV